MTNRELSVREERDDTECQGSSCREDRLLREVLLESREAWCVQKGALYVLNMDTEAERRA